MKSIGTNNTNAQWLWNCVVRLTKQGLILSLREAGWKFVNMDDVARKDPNIVLGLKN